MGFEGKLIQIRKILKRLNLSIYSTVRRGMRKPRKTVNAPNFFIKFLQLFG